MKYSYLIILLVFTSLQLKSQFHSPFSAIEQSLEVGHQIKLSSNNYLHSNFLTNRAYYATTNGSKINTNDLEKMVNRNSIGSALVGSDLTQEIQFETVNKITDSTITSWGVALGNRIFTAASITKDAAHILLRGNRSFLGRSANLDNMQLQYFNAYFVKFFYRFEKNDCKFIVAASPMLAYQGIQATTNKSRFFTSATGDYLDLEANASVNISPQNPNTLSDYGFGLNFSINVQKQLKDTKGGFRQYLDFNLMEIGSIIYGSKSRQYQVNESFAWDGFSIEDIFNPGSSNIRDQRPDSIFRKILDTEKNKGFTQSMPFWLSVGYSLKTERFTGRIALGQLFFTRALPQLKVESSYMLNEKWHWINIVHLGGFTGINLGTGIQFTNGKTLFSLYTADGLSLLMPSQLGGLSGFLSISRRWI